MANDLNSKAESTLSSLGSGLSETASAAASEIQTRSADAFAKITDAAQQATQQAKVTAASLASEANEHFTEIISAQIDAGADLVDQAAAAARNAADTLDEKSPQLAGLIRHAAQSAEEFAHGARQRTPAEIVDMTAQYARREPGVFLGAAAIGGFLLARFLKSSAQNASSPDESPEDRLPAASTRSRLGEASADEPHDA